MDVDEFFEKHFKSFMRHKALFDLCGNRSLSENFYERRITSFQGREECLLLCIHPNLSLEFFMRHISNIIKYEAWYDLSRREDLSEDFIEKYQDRLWFEIILEYNRNITNEFLEKYSDKISNERVWGSILCNEYISEELTEKIIPLFDKEVSLEKTLNPNLSPEFYERHLQTWFDLDIIHDILCSGGLTEDILERNYPLFLKGGKLIFGVLFTKNLSLEFFEKHEYDIELRHWDNILRNKTLSRIVVEKYLHYIPRNEDLFDLLRNPNFDEEFFDQLFDEFSDNFLDGKKGGGEEEHEEENEEGLNDLYDLFKNPIFREDFPDGFPSEKKGGGEEEEIKYNPIKIPKWRIFSDSFFQKHEGKLYLGKHPYATEEYVEKRNLYSVAGLNNYLTPGFFDKNIDKLDKEGWQNLATNDFSGRRKGNTKGIVVKK